ncbi:multiple epidermal growth factor-like domains protein 10 [Dreissena polymorpha]|uniref:multiple epidermal growth factor-like domains protein 10 n=1 Tax=Dreissena polymorpha TaxID=45954 RepID=UPI002264587E|nr:multiple epidermal growth factor-like domains protein 10 [Dreissena polymorpha]
MVGTGLLAVCLFLVDSVKGQEGVTHTLVKRGARPSNCYHQCDTGCPNGIYRRCDGVCYNGYCNCNPGWTGQYCKEIDCNSGLYCKNGGTCNTVTGGQSYECTCRSGYTGTNCTLIDCNSGVYCKNGGTCRATNEGLDYQCTCTKGWTGKNCTSRGIRICLIFC